MTGTEWLACDDPIAMLEFLRGSPTGEDRVSWGHNVHQWHDPPHGSDRRFRLFACGCCRQVWDRIPEECNRAAVAATDEWLEGRIPPGDMEDAFRASSAVEWLEDGSGRRPERGYWIVKYLGRGFYKMTAGASALLIAVDVALMSDDQYRESASYAFHGCYYIHSGIFLAPFRWPEPIPATVNVERTRQVAALRDLFGNPFDPVTFAPEWRTDTTSALARTMHETRDFTAMPILADALQDAGCDHAAVLDHCRTPGAHARGCWVVDGVLGKE